MGSAAVRGNVRAVRGAGFLLQAGGRRADVCRWGGAAHRRWSRSFPWTVVGPLGWVSGDQGTCARPQPEPCGHGGCPEVHSLRLPLTSLY